MARPGAHSGRRIYGRPHPLVHKCRRNAQPGELGTTARQLASDTALATGDIHQPQPGGYAGTDMALIDRDEDNRKR